MKEGDGDDTIQFETIRLQDFLNWFERHLLSIASFDVDDLLTALSRLDDNTIILKNLASEYKSSLAILSISQNNKALKIFDQIDALALFLPNTSTNSVASSTTSSAISNKAPHAQTQSQVLSILPDSEQLRDIMLKNKSKLTDLASSKKTDAGKAKANLKSSSGSSSVSAPSSSQPSRDRDGGPAKKDKSAAAGGGGLSGAGGSGVGDVATVRQEARHGLLLLEELETLIGRKSFMLEQFSEAKNGVWRPVQDLGRRSAQLPPLADSEKQLLAEAETLRKIVDLYNAARGVEILSKMAKLKGEAEQIGDVTLTLLLPIRAIMGPPSVDALQTMAGGARKGWLTTLVNVLKLNVFDLLSLGSNESVRNSFLSSIAELQKLLAAQKDSSPQLLSVDPSVLAAVRGFDADLFLALLEDGAERVSLYNSLTKSEEFTKCYKHLTLARSAVAKAKANYEKAHANYMVTVQMHEEVAANLLSLKRKLEELAWSELGQLVAVT